MAVERGEELVRRYRLVAGLRLLSALSLLVLAAAFFRQPLQAVLGPRVAPVTGAIFQPRASPGFMLRISSQPAGAEVLVDGAPRGSTPALLNVECEEGEKVTLAVTKPGFAGFEQSFACREGQTAIATITLRARSP